MGIYCKGPFPHQTVLQSQICIYEFIQKLKAKT